jgi:hypothetical protein
VSGSAGAIARALAERIDQLAPELLPAGRYDHGRRYWRCGSVAGEPGQSLAIVLRGHHRGRWRDWAAGEGGDALDLVAQVACGGDLGRALDWARAWLGLGRLGAAAPRAQREAKRPLPAAREVETRRQAARRIWLAAAPLRPGDLGWRYLAGRGIDLAVLPRPPAALRIHPALWHAPSGQYWPALVAAIAGADGAHLATHRTWLAPRADGGVGKAAAAAKMTLGAYHDGGGAVHLTRGASGRPWRQAPPGETIAIGEGIEDVLTVACARPDWRTAACCTALSYLARIALPPGCRRVVVIAQNDPLGSEASRALTRGLAALRERGIAVAVLWPPVTCKDINECVQQRRW